MEELIKYFESLEARINALEQSQVEIAEKQAANDEKLAVLGEKILAVGSHISQMMNIIQEVKSQQQFIAEQEEAPVAEVPQKEETPIEEPKEPEIPIVEPEREELFVAPEPKEPSVPAQKEEPKIVEIPVVEPTPVAEEPASKAVLYGKPVDDIRQAISLGDRFLYQRELFGQNAELMQKTLTDLNGLRSFDEAISYIMTHFKWDSESSTYQQFLVTLHRRFG